MEIVSITEARLRPGLRLVTRRGVPTPWAQAAKGLIEVKGLPCVLAQEGEADPRGAHKEWTGDNGSPFLAVDDEPLRSSWFSILERVDRMGDGPALIPSGRARVEFYGLAHEICGEAGLGWSLRLLMIEGSLAPSPLDGAFPEKVARYLGAKYGYWEGCGDAARARVGEVLAVLADRLGEQSFFLGELSALDIYWAAFGNMFMLLSDEEMPAAAIARDAWDKLGGGQFKAQVPANLAAHHRRMYETHLGLPLQL